MGTCMCGKAKYTEEVALKLIKARKYLKGHYKCSLSDTYHVSKLKKNISPYGSRRFKFNKNRLLRELHTEMATRKAIREKIIQYMLDSYERNKTTKFSSQMVTFAVQQELGSVNKQVIAEEISRLKTREKLIVSLNEKVPDQRGAVYFTLSEILEKETEPSNVTTKSEVPAQTTKSAPVNPFDKVHEKLDELKTSISNSEVTLEDEDFESLANKLEEKLEVKFSALIQMLMGQTRQLESIKEIASSHVTVDGDKLADVINKRLGDLKREDSFVYAVRDQADNVTDTRMGQYTDLILQRTELITERMQRMVDTIAELKGVPASVSNSDDYRAGIKDGIRMALEMGLKLDE